MNNIINRIFSYFKKDVDIAQNETDDNQPDDILLQAVVYFRTLDIERCNFDFKCKTPYVSTVDGIYKIENVNKTENGIVLTISKNGMIVTGFMNGNVANNAIWKEFEEYIQNATNEWLFNQLSGTYPKQLELFPT